MTDIISFEHDDMASGTSHRGYVTATYDELVKRFGEPTFLNGDKTTVEWSLQFQIKDIDGDTDYVTATIYDWKSTSTPEGEYRWNIGGFDYMAEDVVYQALKENQGQLA